MARSVFSHAECDQKNVLELKAKLIANGRDWESEPIANRYGRVAVYGPPAVDANPRWGIEPAPLFTEQREFIKRLLVVEEE